MDAVAAPDGRRQFVFEGAALERGKQPIDIGDQNIARARKLNRQRRIQHVGRGHALMHEARFGADEFRQMR